MRKWHGGVLDGGNSGVSEVKPFERVVLVDAASVGGRVPS